MRALKQGRYPTLLGSILHAHPDGKLYLSKKYQIALNNSEIMHNKSNDLKINYSHDENLI